MVVDDVTCTWESACVCVCVRVTALEKRWRAAAGVPEDGIR